jgi:hypothetical protein
LRSRTGAAGFAAAWDAAAAEVSRRRSIARRSGGLYERAVEGRRVPVRYRRRVVAVERRHDDAALIRLLGMLDRLHRNPMNGEGGLFSPMDPELLSAFKPDKTFYLPPEPGGPGTIGGGATGGHLLEDGDRPSFPET